MSTQTATQSPEQILYHRKNPVLTEREKQLRTNLLALKGGKPYIRNRLWRAPNESELSWTGKTKLGNVMEGLVGRIDRACIINDAGRVSDKVIQYLASKKVARSGINPEFESDVTGTGKSINEFFKQANETLTACQWFWIQANRGAPLKDPVTGMAKARTVAQREVDGDRIRWAIWMPFDILDWRFDESGRLIWLLTNDDAFDNTDPFADPKKICTRTLWQRNPTGAIYRTFVEDGDKVKQIDKGNISCPWVPFRLVGTPSPEPWWYDDVEMCQAQSMNLDSLHIETLVKTVFPQLVIPEGQLDMLAAKLVEVYGMENGQVQLQVIKEILRGLDSPMVEGDGEANITRFITPDSNGIAAIPTEIERKRKLLFDMVGLALFNRETRQVQTVESKQFDHLDTESTLRHRATVMQEAEVAMVELSRMMDKAWPQYTPAWPQEFGVIDPQTNITAVSTGMNVPGCTLTMRKVGLKSIAASFEAFGQMTDEDKAAIAEEIQDIEETSLTYADETTPDKKPLPGEEQPAEKPSSGSASAAPVDVVADTALNGAQVTSLVDVVSKVSLKQLPPEAAKEIIKSAFPTMDGQKVDVMINAAAKFTVQQDAPQPPASGQETKPAAKTPAQ